MMMECELCLRERGGNGIFLCRYKNSRTRKNHYSL